jgi:hypothetical protein
MTVAGVLAFSFALSALVRYVDGATLRRWRLSRRWDVPRLAREFITAADEPLATLRGLTHMINAWERGARRPSERYWLLYLRLFPECVTGESVNGILDAAEELAVAEISVTETATFSAAPSVDTEEIRTLTATVRALEQQIAGLTRRLDSLARTQHGEGQPRQASERKRARARYRRPTAPPLWLVFLPAL